jgi:hypothetical protein
MSVYLFLSFEPEDRLLLDEDRLLLLELERVLLTDDPELDDLLVDDLTELPERPELLLRVLLITELPPLFIADLKTDDPNLFRKLLPPDRLELW